MAGRRERSEASRGPGLGLIHKSAAAPLTKPRRRSREWGAPLPPARSREAQRCPWALFNEMGEGRERCRNCFSSQRLREVVREALDRRSSELENPRVRESQNVRTLESKDLRVLELGKPKPLDSHNQRILES